MDFARNIGTLMIGALLFSSCQFEKSGATGWNYNDSKNGGFEKAPFEEQETGPGLILIEGGQFTMGRVTDDLTHDWDNIPRTVTVSSFYMDEVEVTNFYWLEYLYWLDRVFGADYPEIYKKALPDTLVWRSKLAYNEPYLEYYLRHPAYRDYPVVGINWLQANDYCAWRTDRVNELILIREGLFEHYPNQINEDHFTTDAYLAAQYESGKRVDGVEDFNPNRDTRNIRMEDGILLPRYRLPTEAEWEYAAYGLIGNSVDERVVERRIYPWNGHWVRYDSRKKGGAFYGDFRGNFMRGRGDYMGVAGSLNDNADVTAPVFSYWPNDYGLYNMAGNVSEWVMDVYRPLSPEDDDDFRPFRGNVFKTKVLNSDGAVEDKHDLVVYDVEGIKYYLTEFQKAMQGRATEEEAQLIDQLLEGIEQSIEFKNTRKEDAAYQRVQDLVDLIKSQDLEIAPKLLSGISDYQADQPGDVRMRNVTVEENIDRRNYRESDNIDFIDGDINSSIYYDQAGYEGNPMYDWGKTTLINDHSRVYKGASWADRIYWANPGTRRYLDERQSTATIGFRCAMTRVGSPVGLGDEKRRSKIDR
ncbi:MAG TPA: SUMF1/EgtB/PvdO family nonheme iron enzyme [Flavobacteriales bacterium]|nr:SUMF1/EgtB/PvdO family nonheme iron enzyme [Flavobacteriales bacterium]MCB0808999.1 SUMF1/EgtB/PvdO family nonheme iron enzyme [Flavobacteriales bacterium]MCB0817302.1 SUMF1/EgtB/PvdO family nonheme iron enzyme [Flavobacteriales bacterium]HOP43746.1 SUMF1/EgtB/PvdO family nonheme iron enzyme [Flavobacteriales bacterium]